MAERYETDAWLVGELWKRCREMEDQIAELKKDLSVAEEFSRKQTEIINEQEKELSELQHDESMTRFDIEEEKDTLAAEVEMLKQRLKEVTDHRDRLILESASAARPMPTPKPEPVPGWVSANQPIVSLQTGATLQEIADTYGASSGGVSYILSKHGVLKPEKPRAELTKRIDVGKVWALHDAGWTPKRIAEEFFSLHTEPDEIEEILRQPRPIREDEPEEEDEG